MAGPVTYTREDVLGVVRIDDGKANAYSPDVLAAIEEALADVEGDDALRALVLAGRDGMFSGGFDLSIMRRGDRSTMELVNQGGALVRRLYGTPKPVVAACTGHAVAAGAFVLLGSHHRVGASGDFRIGLIETQLGMPLPDWSVELARERLTPRHLQQATVGARVYDPPGAVEAGYLDRVVESDDVLDAARAEAGRLAALDGKAYATNAAKLRSDTVGRMEDVLARDREAAALAGD